MDPMTWVKFVQEWGMIPVLVLILWAGLKGWWIWGWQYKELQRERDAWRELALRGTTLAEQVSKLVSTGAE